MDLSENLITNAAVIAGVSATVLVAMNAWVKSAYDKMAKSAAINVDDYIGEKPSLTESIQCLLAREYTSMGRYISPEPYKLVAHDFEHFPGLKVTKRAANDQEAAESGIDKKRKKNPPIVIGTLRMGFGHHRIAYGAASWAIPAANKSNRDVYFHDIMELDAGESTLIEEAEAAYSKGSQIMTESPDFLGKRMSKATKGGGPNALRTQCHTAELLTSLVSGLDKDSIIISTHPLVGATAIAAGYKNVINLVVDNHAQWFVVVPGAMNLIQGPRLYLELLKLGVPEEEMQLMGHWCPRELVEGIPEAVPRRIRRIEAKKPLRLIIPVGGAGAQKTLLKNIIDACAPLVKEGKLQLFLNAGDHLHIDKAFTKQLEDSGLDYDTVSDVQGLESFQKHLLTNENNEPNKAVTLFAYNEDQHYPAVRTTDMLCEVADVLVCKPSEMAFYCIPKLMIRRVGDHEQKSALRAAELGDGTLEARTVKDVMADIDQFLNHPSVLINMNRAILKNDEIGIYDGGKEAIEMALERFS